MRCLQVWLILLIALIAIEFELGEGRMTKKPVKRTTAALKTKNNVKSKGVKSPAKPKPANKKMAHPKLIKTTKRAPTTLNQKRVQLNTTASKKNVAVDQTTSVKTDFKSSAKPITIKQTTKTTTIDVAKLLNDLKSFNQVETKTTLAKTTTPSESTSVSPSTPSVEEVGPILTIQQTLLVKEPTFPDIGDYNSQLIPQSEAGQSVPALKVAEQGITPLAISATFFDAAGQVPLVTTTSTYPSTIETNSPPASSTTTTIPTTATTTTLTSPTTSVQPLTTTTRPTTTTTTATTTTTTIQRTTSSTTRSVTTSRTTVKASFQKPMLVFAKIALPIAMVVSDTTTSSTSTVGFDANNSSIVEFPNGTESPTALLAFSTSVANSTSVKTEPNMSFSTSQILTTAAPCVDPFNY